MGADAKARSIWGTAVAGPIRPCARQKPQKIEVADRLVLVLAILAPLARSLSALSRAHEGTANDVNADLPASGITTVGRNPQPIRGSSWTPTASRPLPAAAWPPSS